MKIPLTFLLALSQLVLVSCNGEPVASSDRSLVAGKQAGGIHSGTKRADLDALFGDMNVKDATLPGPEGAEFKGTVVFPDIKGERIELIWSDSDNPEIDLVRLSGGESSWRSKEGVALGLTLKDLEKLNGKPFNIYGFEWDYGGYVADFNGGALDGKPGETFSIRFATKEGDDTSGIAGSQIFLSSHEDFQRINPIIAEISLRLRPEPEEETQAPPIPDSGPPSPVPHSTKITETLPETGAKPKSTKESTKEPFDVPAEVLAFVAGLIESEPQVAAQYEELIAQTKEDAGGRFDVGPLVAIEWLVPNAYQEFRDGKGLREGESVYLVQQPLHFGFRGGYSVDDNVVAQVRAKFEEDHGYDSVKDEYFFTKSTLTLTFEGFVTLTVSSR